MNRRGPHEGSIYLRQDGRWAASLHLGYMDGKRRRKHFYGRTRREVQEQLMRALHDAQAGIAVATDGREKLETYLERWLIAHKSVVRLTTYIRYEELLRRHVIPSIGQVKTAKLTPDDVQRLMIAKLREGLSPRTVNHIRAVLRRALNQAVRRGLIARNPAADAEPLRVTRHPIQFLAPADARTFIAGIRGDRHEALYVVALALGLRLGEALALTWADVDFERGWLTVRHSLQRARGGWRLVEPKSEQSRRTMIAPPLVMSALGAHRSKQLRDRLVAGGRWEEHDFVFTTTIGTPLDATNVGHGLHRLLSRLGLPRMRFHDLRHSAASLLLAQGVHPRVVMELLGHSQVSLTLNTYSHVIPALAGEAATRMQAALTVEA